MGFFQNLGRVFGIGKSKDQGDYGGRKPYGSLAETQQGKLSTGELKERLAGRNVGFRPEFLDLYAPWAKEQRADLERYTKPGIRAAGSARGLGRSSIGQSQERLATQETEEAIGTMRAGFQEKDEMQRRQEMNQALTDLQRQAVEETNVRLGASNFDYGEFTRQQGFRERADAQQQAGLLRGVQTIAGAAAGGFGGIPGLAQGGLGATMYGASTAGGFQTSGVAGELLKRGYTKDPVTGALVRKT